ncbi:MAG TPA: pyridoxamine 5'-phosphate oxidase family protein [Thermomicrobiales bacterium]|jgi:general stress protein 26|nr:pyridoxamine 5'-phosphate oxidase family protein [Thermomicrobiales bacterium]
MSDQPTHEEAVRKVAELLKDQRIGMLTTVDPDGTFTSRPMAMQEVEFDGSLWFFAERTSRKVQQLAAHPQVNVAVSAADSWISLNGTASVVPDTGKKAELWNAAVDAWFPDGKSDPNIVLLRVDSDSAEYWDSPGGRIASLFSFAKAKATGKPYEGGENAKVDL